MKKLLTFLLMLSPSAAYSHVGHLGDVAGHDHWVAGVAIGTAIGVAIWGVLAGKKDQEASDGADDEASADPDSEPQDA